MGSGLALLSTIRLVDVMV
uniref:Uncharacterized protein n=1 Tax=Moniliophthora roreri TaxID=221103 RepID=A0A0W0FR13_MONRR